MKIRTQLLLTLSLFGLILIGMAASLILTNQQVDRLNRQGEIASRIERAAVELSYLSGDYLMYGEGQQRARWESKFAAFSQDLAQLSLAEPRQKILVDTIRANHQRLRAVFTDVIAAVESLPQSTGGTPVPTSVQVSWSRMAIQSQAIVFDASLLAQQLHDQAERLKQTNLMLILILIIIFGAYLLVNYHLIYQRILRSIAGLQAGTEIIGSGNLDQTIAIRRSDEISELAHAFNRMTANLKEVMASKADLEREIAVRQRAEGALRESKERYRTLFETMTEGFALHEMIDDGQGRPVDYRFLEVNPAFEQQTGLRSADIVGRTVREVIPQIEPFWIERYAEVARTGQPVHFESYSAPLGRWYEVSAFRTQPGRFATVFLDTTERKQAEEALRESEARRQVGEAVEAERQQLYNVLETLPAYVALLTPDYHVSFANRSFRERFGESTKRCFEHLFRRSEPCENCETYKVLQTNAPQHWEWAGPDGRLYDVYDYPFKDTDASPLILELGIDITERKRAEEALQRQTRELERSNADLQQFAYVASHDLQEPLRMVASFTQLLRQRYQDKLDAEANEFIGYAVDGATRMQRMINDLLLYSRVNTRGSEFQPVAMEDVLARVLTNLQVTIRENSAVVTHDQLPIISVDSTQMEQLLQNLIGNAIKFRGDARPQIHISAQCQQGEWVLSVKDNGIGIAPEYYERIFAIFQRLHSREQYPGSGIGLAVCKRIVERHGGRIWVQSTPGKGATFYFSIPERKMMNGHQ